MAPEQEEGWQGRGKRPFFYPTTELQEAETDLHRCMMTYAIEALEIHYADNPMVYVSGNTLLYYDEDNWYNTLAPDCFVAYGVPKFLRESYNVHEEDGIAPRVIIDIISDVTPMKKEDWYPKQYEEDLRIDEYFRFHLRGERSEPHLQGLRRENGEYISIPLEAGNRMYSRNLGLYLVTKGEEFRFYNPRTDEFLRTMQETQGVWKTAEQELARLRAELDALKQQGASN